MANGYPQIGCSIHMDMLYSWNCVEIWFQREFVHLVILSFVW